MSTTAYGLPAIGTPEYIANPETKDSKIEWYNSTGKALTAGCLVWITGTGSALHIENSHRWKEDLQYRFPIEVQDEHTGVDSSTISNVKSPVQHLEFIRDTIAPSITDLALLIGVSRQTVHKWLAGGNPDQDHVDKIVAIGDIAEQVARANLSQPQWLIKMKVFDGQSLVDLITESAFTKNHVEILIAEARKVESDYQNSAIHNSSATPTDDWKSDSSVPYLEG